MKHIVSIEATDVFPSGLGDAIIPVIPHQTGRGAPEEPGIRRFLPLQFFHFRNAGQVCGATFDYQHLKIAEGLAGDRIEASRESMPVVETRNDYAEKRAAVGP